MPPTIKCTAYYGILTTLAGHVHPIYRTPVPVPSQLLQTSRSTGVAVSVCSCEPRTQAELLELDALIDKSWPRINASYEYNGFIYHGRVEGICKKYVTPFDATRNVYFRVVNREGQMYTGYFVYVVLNNSYGKYENSPVP
mgnify:CR=1 FL=1